MKNSLIIFFILLAGSALAQNITISGHVTDPTGHNTLINVMVVNQQSGNGTFANADGTFAIIAGRRDTIMVTARDFSIKKICFRDSANRSHYNVFIKLDSIHYQLQDVYIHPLHTLPEIDKDRSTVGDIPNTDTYKTYTAMSPITALYERFSRIEQSKRKVAQLEDDEKKRQVLKDLLHLYVKYDILQLTDQAFDSFITYCNFSDVFIKQSTDYELIMAIKQKYERYTRATSTDYYTK